MNKLIQEEVTNLQGKKVVRIKSSLFYLLSLLSLVVGLIFLIQEIPFGLLLVATIFPILLLYPLIRFLFGGKDGLLVVLLTIFFEEYLKKKIVDIAEKKKK
jgi:hypothetical protein